MVSPGLSIVFGVIATASFGLAIYKFVFEKKMPRYQTLERQLIGESESRLPRKLKIEYEGRSVEQLTVSYFVFWNRGFKTIRRQDNVPTSPLRVVASPDGEILEANVTRITREVNEFGISLISSQEAKLEFEYMDRRDGAAIQVYHTSDTQQITIEGAIMGAKQGVKNIGRVNRLHPRHQTKVICFCIAYVVFISVIVGLSSSFSEDRSFVLSDFLWTALPVAVLVIAITGATYFVTAWHPFPKKLYPEGETLS